ncbi:MAG: SixA phosphatase family protein [Leadbetterella sp.]
MAKDLYLLRHATAEEGSVMFRDIDRELTSHGIMESARIGSFIKDLKPEVIYTSSAVRTTKTAELVVEMMKVDTDLLQTDENLYGGGPRAYLGLLNNIDNTYSRVLIVGHNPDITFFAEYLCSNDMGGDLNKATLVHIRFELDSWAEISQKSGNFILRQEASAV